MSTQIRGNKQIKSITIQNDQIANETIELGKLKDGAELLKRDGSVAATGDFNLGSHQIKNLAAPVDANDAIRKADLDAATSGQSIFREIPSGSVNGSNTEFTLAHAPNSGTEQVFLNGALLNSGANSDYVVSDSTITFTLAPQSGDVILVNYITDGVVVSLDVTNSLNQFNARLTTAEGELFDVQGDVVGLQSSLTTLQGRVTTAEGDISTLESDVSSVQSSVSTLQSSVSTVQSGLTSEASTRAAADSALSSDISTLQSSATSLGNRVTAVEGDVAALESADAAFDTRVGDVEDGLQAETTARTNADNALSSRVTALEGVTPFSGSYTDLTNKPTIPSAIDDLSDVTITSAATDQFLKYNGSAWVNSALPSAGDVASGIVTTSTQSFAGTKTFLSGTVLQANSAGIIPATVRAAASQTANLFQIQNSSQVNLLVVDASGNVVPPSVSTKALNLKALASQTAAIFDVQNSGDTSLVTVNASGNLGISNGAVASPGLYFLNSTNMGLYRKAANVMGFVANGQPAMTVDGQSGVGRLGVGNTATVVSRLQLVDDGFTSTSGMTFGTNASTYVQMYRSANNTLTLTGGLSIANSSASVKGLVVKGAASQSADMFDVQNSAGTSLFTVNASGSLSAGTVPVARVSGLATVATSGSYNDLSDKPASFSGSYNDLTNKPAIPSPVREVPSGSVNGTNVTFTLSQTPSVANTEQVFLNGLLQFAGATEDYTISGDTITFNTAPEAGWKLVVCYFV